MLRNGALLAAVLATLAGTALFLRNLRDSATPEKARSPFVDSAACSGCHAGIAATYRKTGMGRSFFRPGPENTIEDYENRNEFHHARSERYYRMFRRNGRLYQRRHQSGYGGQETNLVEKEIHYVLGSGNHARSYLHRNGEGKLEQLPVGWYSEKGGFWAMSPGYDRADHSDFRRTITYDCMFCHNGYPEVATGGGQSEPVYPEKLPEGIDCQRCHGPGRAHVEAAANPGASAESVRAAILNPARLSRERQLEVCMQCHLETTSRPLPHAIRRYDRGSFSYRPGEPLSDFILHFDHPADAGYDEKFEIAHAAYRLRKSACFENSAMTCTTCHNPHDVPRGEQAVQRYSAVCRSCHDSVHASEARASANCIGCHMPRRRTDDVVHTVITDHYIQRRKPARDLLAPIEETRQSEESSYRGEVVPYYPRRLPSAPESELYLAVAQVQNSANLAEGIPRLERALERYPDARPEFPTELAEAYWKSGQRDKAIEWYEAALRKKPDHRPGMRRLALAYSRAGRLAEAASLLEKAAAMAPPDPASYNNLGEVYLLQEKIDQAETALRKALEINPELPEANNLLAQALSRKGDRAAAEAGFREAIRAQPDYAVAHNNLANLLAESGDLAQARYHFDKATRLDPTYAVTHYNYGLALARNGLFEEALAKLNTAVRLDPTLAQAHNDLGNIMAATGRLDRAVAHYREAIRLKPDLPEARFNLGTALAQQQNRSEAIAQFEAALRLNPEYYEAHFNLARLRAEEGDTAAARIHFQQSARSPNPDLRQAALDALR